MDGKPGHVAICGAGPAGALLAFLLARGGVRVTLIERHTDLSREFRGEGMSPSGMAAIRQAGLWNAFDALPATHIKSMAMYAKGRPFLQFDMDHLLPPDMQFIRVMAQQHLLEMLIDKASAFEGFTFLRGVVVRDAIERDGRIAGVSVGEGGGSRDLAADYVVAADGRYSVLRKRAGLDLGGKQQSFDVVWSKIPRPDGVPAGRVYGFLLDNFFGLIFPTEGDHLQIGRIIPKGSYRDLRSAADGDWYDHVLEILPQDLVPAFASVRDRASDPALLDVICGSLPKWSAPGLCFIGDAAHPMSPIGAQGINIALRDAIVAANHLGPPLLEGGDAAAIDAAAEAFEAERRPEVDKIQAQQNDATRQLKAGRLAAPVLRVIPDSWVAAVGRFFIGLPSTRRFIEGAGDLRLTFGVRDGGEAT